MMYDISQGKTILKGLMLVVVIVGTLSLLLSQIRITEITVILPVCDEPVIVSEYEIHYNCDMVNHKGYRISLFDIEREFIVE